MSSQTRLFRFAVCALLFPGIFGCQHTGDSGRNTSRATSTSGETSSDITRAEGDSRGGSGAAAADAKPTAGRHAGAAGEPGPGPAANDHDHGAGAPHKHFSADGDIVRDHGIPLVRETDFGRWDASKRAVTVAQRLNELANTHGLEDQAIFMKRLNGLPTVFFYHHHGPESEGHIIATVDPGAARRAGSGIKPASLAYWWRDILRDHILIMDGAAPRWTTRYTRTLRNLYERVHGASRGVPSHETFERVLAHLPSQEKGQLMNLYIHIPVSYRPSPDNVRAAAAELLSAEGGTRRRGLSHTDHYRRH